MNPDRKNIQRADISSHNVYFTGLDSSVGELEVLSHHSPGYTGSGSSGPQVALKLRHSSADIYRST